MKHMGVCAPIIVIPILLNMSLSLGFSLDQRNDLGTELHQVCLVHNTSDARKFLKARVNQHQAIAGGVVAPTLADTAYLTVPDRVTLPENLAMAQITHALLHVVLYTLI